MINNETLETLRKLTEIDLLMFGMGSEQVMLSLGEEYGELATAVAVENGLKSRELTEPAHCEAVDMIICGLAMYYLVGGDLSRIDELIKLKLEKWKDTQVKKTQEMIVNG